MRKSRRTKIYIERNRQRRAEKRAAKERENFHGKDDATGIEYGINSDGNLYLGDDKSGYNLPDTPENRETVLADFRRYTEVEEV